VIIGTNFTGTEVKFGGTPAASFTVNSSTQITAVVGAGATGKVTVTTANGTAQRADTFIYNAPVYPSIYWVNIQTGSDTNNGREETPWKTLHHAISMLNAGSSGAYVLQVALGTYSKANGEADAEMILTQNSVNIMGQQGSGPVLNGTGASHWSNGLAISGSNNMVQNLHVTGFSGESQNGIYISSGSGNIVKACELYANYDAVSIFNASSCAIKNCEIYNNTNDGISIEDSAGNLITQNQIHGNTGTESDGIIVQGCSPEISRNELYDNTFNVSVVGDTTKTASPIIKNNLIYEATSGKVSYGVIISGYDTATVRPKIYHNTIDRGEYEGIVAEKNGTSVVTPEIKYNIVTNFRQYGIKNSGGNPVIDYNDVWNNASGNYSGCSAGGHDISQDPLYGSYALQSTSPCIDRIGLGSGDPVTLDYPGFKRPKGSGFDMGAYEYMPTVFHLYPLPGGTGLETDYRIFTVPIDVKTGAGLLSVMESQLGFYDPTRWRVFAYQSGTYLEINTPAFESMTVTPGMAFWMITAFQTEAVLFEGGISPDGVNYILDLPSGWSLFGLPWMSTPIDLGNIYVTDGVHTYPITSPDNTLTQRCVWDYTGSGPYSGFVKRDTAGYTLQCWTGYFIKVLADHPVRVIIPPENTAPVLETISAYPASVVPDSEEPPPPPGAQPIPDIKANGQDGPIVVSSEATVSVAVTLDPGSWAGREADWWIAAYTPFSWYTYIHPSGWRAGIHRCVQIPLVEIATPIEVLNRTLPKGQYIFYFGVDGNTDGLADGTWMDSVNVEVK